MRFPIPIVGGHAKGRSVDVNAQETINLYPVLNKGAKYGAYLLGCPGLVEVCDTGYAKQIRNMKAMGDTLYAVVGDKVFGISTSWAATELTGTVSGTSGHVYMEHDGTNLMTVVPDIEGYTYSVAGGAVAAIADSDFPTPGSLTWQDGYFIVSSTDTGRFYRSDLRDPTAWNALMFATKEAKPDNLARVFSDHLNLWLFGEKSIEVWYNDSGSGLSFSRYGNTMIEQGIIAPASVVSVNGRLFWLDDRKTVLMAQGFQAVGVSTPELEYALASYSTVSDAIGFGYTQEGVSFYFLTFPTARKTWILDTNSMLWHERRSYPVLTSGEQSRHRASCYAYFNGKHLIGDHSNGKIYEWKLDAYDDDGEDIIAKRRFAFVHKDMRRIIFNRLMIDMEAGVGLSGSAAAQNLAPEIMLSWSDDGGHTWSNELTASIGGIGQHSLEIYWNRLGQCGPRGRIFDLSISAKVKRVMQAAFVDIEIEGD